MLTQVVTGDSRCRPWGSSWTLHSTRLWPLRSVQSAVGASAVRGTASVGGDEALEFLEPGHRVWWQCRSAVRARRSRSATPIRGIFLARGPVNHGMVPTATGQGQRVSFNVIP